MAYRPGRPLPRKTPGIPAAFCDPASLKVMLRFYPTSLQRHFEGELMRAASNTMYFNGLRPIREDRHPRLPANAKARRPA